MKRINYRAFDYKHKGTNHRYNQDFTSVRPLTDGSVIAAIADGCSSEALSGIGSYFLCDTITGDFCERFNSLYGKENVMHPKSSDICSLSGEDVKRRIDHIVSDRLNFLCDGFKNAITRSFPEMNILDVPTHLFACTLIVILALSNGTTYIYHIGDGVVLGCRKDNNKVEILSEPRNLGSQCRTFFASDYGFVSNAVFSEYKGGRYSGYFMTTDGWDKALADGADTTSNLKALAKSLSDYSFSDRENFYEILEKTRETMKSDSPARVEDDMSCIWITDKPDNVIFDRPGELSVKVKAKNDDQYEVKSAVFGKSKVVIRFRKIKEKKPDPQPATYSFNSEENAKECSHETPRKRKRDKAKPRAKLDHGERTLVPGKNSTG